MEVNDTLAERGNRYGNFEDNARLTQALMDTLDDLRLQELSPVHREAIHMIFHKIARMSVGDQWYDDNPRDIAGYALLLEEHIQEVLNEDFND